MIIVNGIEPDSPHTYNPLRQEISHTSKDDEFKDLQRVDGIG